MSEYGCFGPYGFSKLGFYEQFPACGVCFDWDGTGTRHTYERPRANTRSRGKHDPGSGRYVNRWVLGNNFPITGHEDSALFSHLEIVAPKVPGDGLKYDALVLFHWDGEHLFYAAASYQITGTWGGAWYLWIAYDWLPTSPIYYDRGARKWLVHGIVSGGTPFFLGSDEDLSIGDVWSLMREAYTSGHYRLHFGSDAWWELTQWWGGLPDPVDPELRFSEEMRGFDDRVDLLPHFGLDGAMAAAFTNAVDKLPSLDSVNNVANSLELLELLKGALGILINPKMSVDSLWKAGKSAWLSYRYMFCTTKADMSEALSYAERLLDLERCSSIRSNGYYSDKEWTLRCSLKITTDAFAGLRSTIEKYCLHLNAYNAWDLVPYSFVIDWFLDVGSLLERYDSRNIAYRVPDKLCWFSAERRWVNEFGYDEIFYYRYQDTPNLAWVPRVSHGTKAETWIKRGLDSVALFF